MDAARQIIPILAATMGGALNAVAGGGLFLAFPALILTGMPPIAANATSTVALWPGSLLSVGAYRKDLSGRERTLLLAIISVVGSALGTIVLLRTSQVTFSRMLPYLMAGATVLFVFGKQIASRLKLATQPRLAGSRPELAILIVAQSVIALYGGFFGGGLGILMLAMFSMLGMDNIHRMNALKTLLVSCINGAAVFMFLAADVVSWPQALWMGAGATLGGYAGAHCARQLNQRIVRGAVTVVACGMTVYFFRRYG